MTVYLCAAEYITADKGRGEVLLFRRKNMVSLQRKRQEDEESATKTTSPALMSDAKSINGDTSDNGTVAIEKQSSIFHWQHICYDIPVKGGIRRITDHVDGWVKPGMLTALMVGYSF